MALTIGFVAAEAGRPPAELTRRDLARALLRVPSEEALAALPGLRRDLTAAGNPQSAAFWDATEQLLHAIGRREATVGDVRRWLEATGTEPTTMVAGGFLWPEEDERGPVARELHDRLVAHLEEAVAAGHVDPDRLLAGDPDALAGYVARQERWLREPLSDGRVPMWAVSHEEDEAFEAAWQEADRTALELLDTVLDEVGDRPLPHAALSVACDRLRAGLRDGGWPYDLLAAAGGVAPAALPGDDQELWLTLASGSIQCRDDPPSGPGGHDDYASWFGLSHADWLGAVAALARGGPGTTADADALAHYALTSDDVPDGAGEDEWDSDLDEWYSDLDRDDAEIVLVGGFLTVELLWSVLGAIDQDGGLTPLGWWGLPEALRLTWGANGS